MGLQAMREQSAVLILSEIGDRPEYMRLWVGWKAVLTSISNWDLPPEKWTKVMVLYAGIDALASFEVGRVLRRFADPALWTPGMPTLPLNPFYRPLHRRAHGADLLEYIRRALAYCLAREGQQTVEQMSKTIGDWDLIKGLGERTRILHIAVDHLEAAGVVKRVKHDNKDTLVITHVCLTKAIPPLATPDMPPPPAPEVAALLETLKRVVPWLSGIEMTLRDTMIGYLIDHHPELVLYTAPVSTRIAEAWLEEIGEAGRERLSNAQAAAKADKEAEARNKEIKAREKEIKIREQEERKIRKEMQIKAAAAARAARTREMEIKAHENREKKQLKRQRADGGQGHGETTTQQISSGTPSSSSLAGMAAAAVSGSEGEAQQQQQPLPESNPELEL
ncbi:hypothetical protein H9P43_009782 [Blastocladiella emersonii ATCC 22665]|nr:hypothetical protein H9P43_009782 [Blastocladiella emersonii ATCC 22665]